MLIVYITFIGGAPRLLGTSGPANVMVFTGVETHGSVLAIDQAGSRFLPRHRLCLPLCLPEADRLLGADAIGERKLELLGLKSER
jgi:hypothetical protein